MSNLSGFNLTEGMSKGRREFVEAEERKARAPIDAAIAEQSRLLSEIRQAEHELQCKELLTERDNFRLAEICKAYEPTENQSAETVYAAIHEAFTAAKLELTEKGYQIQEPAFTQKVSRVMQLNRNLDTRLTETFDKVIAYMIEVGAFSDRELIAPTPVEPEAPKHPSVDIEDIALESREGNKLAKKLVVEQLVAEKRPLFLEFVQFVRNTYRHPVTQEDQNRVAEFCVNHGGFTVTNLNLARQHVLKCFSEDEKLANLLEQADRPVNDFSVRTDFVRRQKELLNNQ